MKTRNFLLTLVALLAFAGNAWADTTKLLASDGWSKITTLPTATDIANNYYVFVDTNNDLMLGTGKGVNQNTKWYSLGVYYYNSVEPTSKDINNMVWTLETYSNGYSMRNLEYSVLAFQTEWNAAWKWDTNDVPGTNDWTKLFLAYSDGSWTIQNGQYPDSGYLGPWNDGNFTNGAECACNKSGNNVGKFQIYAISRDQFKQNLLDNASASNPVDITPWYVTNATFDLGNRDGWTQDGSGGNNNTSYGGGCEIWHRTGFNIYQDITLPKGKYKVSLQMAGTTGAGQVYGTSGSTTKTAASSAAAGSNFQNTILQMIQDRTFGQTITDEIEVTNGTLRIGMKCETTNQWINFDNFKLYCTGLDLSSYVDQLADIVRQANDFISSNVVPDACESIISDAVTQYNKTYDTAKEYSAAIVALSGVLNTYRNDTQLQNAYANFLTLKNQILQLSDGQESSSELTTFNNAVNAATNNVEDATTVDAVTTQTAALRAAGLTYISTAEGQFDITFLASQNYRDWRKYDGTTAGAAAGIVADAFLTNRPADIPSFAESYETTCATTGTVLWQTIEGLPAGYYQVGMYAAAMFTEGRGFNSEATNGDANRTFAFAGDLNDPSSILRTGAPISFNTVRDFNDLTTLDVNVHLTGSGNTNNLTFGVQKDANGSNWHFAQILSIVYSNQPDLTNLKATRDNLVAEAEGLLAGSSQYLTAEQQQALQAAITAGEAADDFESLNTVTLTKLPDAINTAKQQVAQAKASIPTLHAALERFEQYYNLEDGTDYSRLTMSAKAWTDLLDKVDDATEALDDISQVAQYASIATALNNQMDATDVSIRLFKSYKAMVEGCQSLNIAAATTYGANNYMDTDAAEQEAIGYLNAAFVYYSQTHYGEIDMAGFLGENLDFSGTEADITGYANVKDIAGWEEAYNGISDDWAFITTKNASNADVLYVRANWQSAATLTTSKLKMLPVGKYKLSFDWNSSMANMNNLSAYKLGEASVALGETTSASQTLEYEFEVTENATDFDLVFGFTRTATGSAPAQILVDNVKLVCIVGDEFKLAYEAAQAIDDSTAETAAAKSAVTEYADNYVSTAELNGFVDAEARQTAINVLKNARIIAENNGDATSLVVNGDLTNTTLNGRIPYGWIMDYEGDDTGDWWIRNQDGEQVYNIWAGNITFIDLKQEIPNMPKGAYRLSIDMGTNNIPADRGAAPLFNFIDPSDGLHIGASELVTTENSGNNRNFATYSSAAENGDSHKVIIGVRSEGHYFQMKNIRLEFIGVANEAAVETDNSYARQDFFWWNKPNAETGAYASEIYMINEDVYGNASNVKVYPDPASPNLIIHGHEGMFDTSVKNADNGGTCASLVITDGSPLTNTREFTATSATYSRNMPSYNEGANYREWGTLILPYQVASDENVQFYTMNKVVEDEVNWMSFTPVATVPANTPVVFSTLNSQDVATMAGSGTVATTTAEQGSSSVDFDGWSLEGVYTSTQFTGDDAAGLYYVAQDKFWKASTTSATGLTVAPFRAFFHGPETSSVKSFNIRVVDGDATSIVDLEHGVELGGDVYTVGGQLVRKNAMTLEGLPQGVYIVGGKKVIIR